jgi:3-methyladenine DNA glycosylase/8-oxoguanine DNA glycosylase
VLRELEVESALARGDLARGRWIADVVEEQGPLTLKRTRARSHFESLARAVVFQQLAGKAAAAIWGRVEAVVMAARADAIREAAKRGRLGTPSAPAKAAFSPEALLALDDAPLRAAGLSSSKIATLRALASRVHAGAAEPLPLHRVGRMSDEAIVSALTEVRGIGPWTAEMFLLFRLGRPDVLSVGDFGLRLGLGMVDGGAEPVTPAALRERGMAWAPHRSVASLYLWRGVELRRARGRAPKPPR